MSMKNNNMDKFLRGSLDNLEINPSQNVWKSISKRLLILEVIRLNFTNVGKFWLYSGLATLTTIAGLSYYVTTQSQASELVHEIPETNLVTDPKSPSENTSTVLMKAKEVTSEQHVENRIQTNTKLQIQAEEKEMPDADTFTENAFLTQTAEQNADNVKIVSDNQSKIDQNETALAKTAVSSTVPVTINSQAVAEIREPRSEVFVKLPSRTSPKSSNSLYSYNQSGLMSIPPLLIGSQLKPTEFDQKKMGKTKNKKTQKAGLFKASSNNDDDLIKPYQAKKLQWSASIHYLHDWPLENRDILPQTNMLSIKAGLNWKRWDFNLGIGLQSDNTLAEYEFLYSSYDSVGFFYDIDYYETIPGNPDSIIIHYTINPVFDTVAHSSTEEYSQNSRWVVVPIEVGYQILQKESYVLKAGISARIGWEYYRENNVTSTLPSSLGASYQKVGLQSVSPFISLSIGLENQIKIYDKWWFIIEPQLYYHMKTPYQWDGSKTTGPIGFGINTGIKFKF